MRSSFRDVVKDLYYNQIYAAVDTYVEDYPDTLECYSYIVGTAESAKLQDMEIMSVNIVEAPNNGILFDVIVSGNIQIWGKVSHSSQDDDDAEQWFRVSCEANIDNGLSEFAITDVNIHNPYQKKTEHKLSEFLVPIISKSHFDDVAEEFLQEFYPEGLKQPAPIPMCGMIWATISF